MSKRTQNSAAAALIFGISMASSAVSAGELLPLTPPASSVRGSLVDVFQTRSFPPDLSLVSPLNPWGERLKFFDQMPPGFGERAAAAAEMYAEQNIRFDGYFGSDDDGRHYGAAADGEDNAYYGSVEIGGYRRVRDGVVDDLKERVWICLDLFVHAYSMAGFPVRRALVEDYESAKDIYTIGGTFPENVPAAEQFFRRVRNVQTYFQRRQHYSEQRITKQQYRDPNFRPTEAFKIGDLLFFGHYGDENGEKGWWRPQHTGIVASLDERGLPVRIINMRVSRDLVDSYDGEIKQTRTIAGKPVFFKRFSDRYPLIGFGRVLNWPEPAVDEEEPRPTSSR